MKPKQTSVRKKWRRLLWVAAAPFVLLLGVIATIRVSTRDQVTSRLEELPNKSVAIVFGAGVLPGGRPSLVLADRLLGAIDLYRSGKVEKLLMSGDNSTAYYNEPEAMRRFAVAHGVPNADITLDFAGRDTYDTCYRAKHVFGVHEAILVTQAYHAPRAEYIAEALGIDAVAFAVPEHYVYNAQAAYSAREYLADVKAWWDVEFSHRQPYVGAGRAAMNRR